MMIAKSLNFNNTVVRYKRCNGYLKNIHLLPITSKYNIFTYHRFIFFEENYYKSPLVIITSDLRCIIRYKSLSVLIFCKGKGLIIKLNTSYSKILQGIFMLEPERWFHRQILRYDCFLK